MYITVLIIILLRSMHVDAGGRDLDNEFFLQLATPGVWVNSTVYPGLFTLDFVFNAAKYSVYGIGSFVFDPEVASVYFC